MSGDGNAEVTALAVATIVIVCIVAAVAYYVIYPLLVKAFWG